MYSHVQKYGYTLSCQYSARRDRARDASLYCINGASDELGYSVQVLELRHRYDTCHYVCVWREVLKMCTCYVVIHMYHL